MQSRNRLRVCINKIKITDYKDSKDYTVITGQAYEITVMLRTPCV